MAKKTAKKATSSGKGSSKGSKSDARPAQAPQQKRGNRKPAKAESSQVTPVATDAAETTAKETKAKGSARKAAPGKHAPAQTMGKAATQIDDGSQKAPAQEHLKLKGRARKRASDPLGDATALVPSDPGSAEEAVLTSVTEGRASSDKDKRASKKSKASKATQPASTKARGARPKKGEAAQTEGADGDAAQQDGARVVSLDDVRRRVRARATEPTSAKAAESDGSGTGDASAEPAKPKRGRKPPAPQSAAKAADEERPGGRRKRAGKAQASVDESDDVERSSEAPNDVQAEDSEAQVSTTTATGHQAGDTGVVGDADDDADLPEGVEVIDGIEPISLLGSEDAEAEPELSEADETRRYLKGVIEAVLFSSDRALSLRELSRSAKLDRKRTLELLKELRRDYRYRGLNLCEVSGGFCFRSSPRYAEYVQKVLALRPVRLTRPQLETLAIIAYRQPVTRPEIDDIRGVDSGPVLKGLMDRELIKILGKKDEAGRPMLYGTGPAFLELFSLESLKDLPSLREFAELSEESRSTFEAKTGEVAPAGAAAFEEAVEGEFSELPNEVNELIASEEAVLAPEDPGADESEPAPGSTEAEPLDPSLSESPVSDDADDDDADDDDADDDDADDDDADDDDADDDDADDDDAD
ncbi:MAG TPA: SMC-Scp complex subunit ScpB, partial [Polyangiaceae bacterium]|nr:SMC-Scp complex subunit ScpB [Polyangiaceae bacterium]